MAEEWVEKLQNMEDQGVCCKFVHPRNVRSYTQKVSISLSTRALCKLNNNKHTKVNWDKAQSPQPYTKINSQLMDAENERNRLL